MDEPQTTSQKVTNLEARIVQARTQRDRQNAFLEAFPPLPSRPQDRLPPITWAEIERQLLALAGPNTEGLFAEIEILRASARRNPPELFYHDLFALAWCLIDGANADLTSAEEAAMD